MALYLFSFVFVVVLQNIMYFCKVRNVEGAMGIIWPCICFPLYLLLYFRILCIFVRSGIWKEQWALRKSKFCGSRHKPTENERASVGVNEKEKRTSKNTLFTLYTDTDYFDVKLFIELFVSLTLIWPFKVNLANVAN